MAPPFELRLPDMGAPQMWQGHAHFPLFQPNTPPRLYGDGLLFPTVCRWVMRNRQLCSGAIPDNYHIWLLPRRETDRSVPVLDVRIRR